MACISMVIGYSAIGPFNGIKEGITQREIKVNLEL